MIYIVKKCLSVCLSRFIVTFLSEVYSELSAVRGNKTLRKPTNVPTQTVLRHKDKPWTKP